MVNKRKRVARQKRRKRRKKLKQKCLDLVAANDLTAPGAGFAVDTNQITIIDTSGAAEEIPLLPKYDVSHRLLDRVVTLLKERE